MPSPARQHVLALALIALLAVLALGAGALPGLRHVGALALALLLGLGLRALWRAPGGWGASLAWAAKSFLRWGIVLLGLRLDLILVWEAGFSILAISASVVAGGLVGISWLGRRLGLDPVLATLIAVDSSICGGSAVAAAAPTIGARERDVALVVPLCSLLGTVLMLGYTLLHHYWPVDDLRYGVLVGASLHEVAQVVAAVTPFSGTIEPGMVAKLSRVALLIPAVALIGHYWHRAQAHYGSARIRVANAAHSAAPQLVPETPGCRPAANKHTPQTKPQPPHFVLGFFAVSVANTTLLHAWPQARSSIEQVDGLLLSVAVFIIAMAMAAMGLGTDFAHLRKNGLRAAACALLGWLGIASLVALELILFF